jgi:hypothetical protein
LTTTKGVIVQTRIGDCMTHFILEKGGI